MNQDFLGKIMRTKNIIGISLLVLGLGAVSANAGEAVVVNGGHHQHGGGGYHGGNHHGGGHYGGGYHGYPNQGGFYYGGGGWWGGPNVVINVPPPAPRYYVAPCENMEVCDAYGDCWIEQYCG